MKKRLLTLILAIGIGTLAVPALAQQVIGATAQGTAVTEDTASGWSVKQSLLGKAVYNQNNERVGAINDLIIGPQGTISHVIVAAGGFVGERRHDVAIDAASLETRAGRFYVDGATRENIKAVPKFEYAAWL